MARTVTIMIIPSGLLREWKGRSRKGGREFLLNWRCHKNVLEGDFYSTVIFHGFLKRLSLLGFPTAVPSGQWWFLIFKPPLSFQLLVFQFPLYIDVFVLETHYPPILSSWIGIRMTLGWLFLPCGPHLVYEAHSVSFALTNFGNAAQSKYKHSLSSSPLFPNFPRAWCILTLVYCGPQCDGKKIKVSE